jgi:hypothetical protein
MTSKLSGTIPADHRPVPPRKGPGRRILAVLAVTGLAAAGVPSASAGAAGIDRPRTATAAALVSACVDFIPIPDNTSMGTDFLRNGFAFRSPAAAGIIPFVNEGLDVLGALVHGLQFPDAGLLVKTPAPADAVHVKIAVFHPPQVVIRAVNAAGVVVDSASVPADNTRHTVTLDGVQDISRLRFTGGGEEAIVEEVCTD